MTVFSYHLIRLPFIQSVRGLMANPLGKNTPGLVHAEFMTAMTLGSPIVSPARFLLRQVAIFAQWENEQALDAYLEQTSFGKTLAKGWHVRLAFVRQWGSFSDYKIPETKATIDSPADPVVAVTIARMRPLQVPRFIAWGRPAEQLVRDHPGTALSLASIRFPNTVSTFSIWKTEKEMTDMVHGHSKIPMPKRHSDAMKERDRKDFHFEFTTLRFKPLAEHGSWKGQSHFIPGLQQK
jgi:hypothetical protein